jgi:hypothetical protein
MMELRIAGPRRPVTECCGNEARWTLFGAENVRSKAATRTG